MDSNRTLTVEGLLQAALLTHPEERPALLRSFSQGDTALLMEVEFLLAAHEEAQRILRTPPSLRKPRPTGTVAIGPREDRRMD